MSMVSNLPAIPDDDYDNYIIYQRNNGDYYLTCFDNLYSDTLQNDGDVDYGTYIFYKLNGDNWDYGGGYLSSHALYNDGFPHADELDVITSTVTLYNPDGTVYCYGSSSYGGSVPLISGVLSSSDFISLFDDLWVVLPVLLVAVLVLVGFRKAWGFIRNLIRGA